MAAAEAEAGELEPESGRLRAAEAELGAEREEFERRLGEGLPGPTWQAAEVRGELGQGVVAGPGPHLVRARSR